MTFGETLLSYAVCNGHDRLGSILTLLFEKGTQVDSESDISVTLFLSAAVKGHESVVNELLLETGKVNPDLRDEDGRTPLSWAAEKGHDAVTCY
jgi:ankyrin repeat protein